MGNPGLEAVPPDNGDAPLEKEGKIVKKFLDSDRKKV
jgi:hypothetical protein